MEIADLKKGMLLTAAYNGEYFKKGEQYRVKEVIMIPGKWQKFFCYMQPDKLTGFKIYGIYGIWFPRCFEETKHLQG